MHKMLHKKKTDETYLRP